MAPFSAPFRYPGSLLASLWLPFRRPLEAFRPDIGRQRLNTPVKGLVANGGEHSATNLPRCRREPSENSPRTCREPAENVPRTSREPTVRTPGIVALHIATSLKGLRSPTNASTKSPRIKMGRRSPPLGVYTAGPLRALAVLTSQLSVLDC